ncbi:MAG: Fe-S protein assembly co-chaperone HscB [Psychromonas sp.]|nr:Fe-S protein assembly co-chaperone HscB [Psychromonas sp.]
MNHFELFSIPATFAVDQTQLSTTYRQLQKQFHPDNFAMHSDAERLLAMQKSTQINDAYQTLKNSCLRAQYLLLLAGYDIKLEKTLQDTEFLMQQMLWREKIASFTEHDEDEIEQFAENIQQQVKTLESLIASQLQSGELEVTANTIRKLQFMLKLQSELELLEEKLFD